jgi:Ca2+-binding EF-hand superfamily protein
MSRITLSLLVPGLIFAASALGQGKPASPAPAQQSQAIVRAQFLAQMDTLFRQIDADKNGQLTRTEIEQHQQQSALAEAKARNRAQFVELDANKNGQLSPAEFAKLTPPAAAGNAGPMLAREDSNRDSQISLIEHRTSTLANFDRVDTDKDGVVTPAEMKAGGIAPR